MFYQSCFILLLLIQPVTNPEMRLGCLGTIFATNSLTNSQCFSMEHFGFLIILSIHEEFSNLLVGFSCVSMTFPKNLFLNNQTNGVFFLSCFEFTLFMKNFAQQKMGHSNVLM